MSLASGISVRPSTPAWLANRNLDGLASKEETFVKASAPERFFLGLVIALLPAVATTLEAPEPARLVEKASAGAEGRVHIVDPGRAEQGCPPGERSSWEHRMANR